MLKVLNGKFAEEGTKIKIAAKGTALTVEQLKSFTKAIFPVNKIPVAEVQNLKTLADLVVDREPKFLVYLEAGREETYLKVM